MIEFKIKGCVVRLTRKEWNSLKKRFNPKNAKYLYPLGRYYIDVACILCAEYKDKGSGNCNLCPFSVFADNNRTNGCLDLLEKIFPAQKFAANHGDIRWDESDNYAARKQLNSILRRMKDIEMTQIPR